MINYQITVTSKNLKAIKNFLLFCFQKKNFFNIKTTFYKIKNKKKTITTLKSPHVNKKAQSQLEYRFFSTKIKIVSSNTQYLILLKKIKSKLFPEIKIKTKFTINKQDCFQSKIQLLNPKNYIINNLNQFKIKKMDLQNFKTINQKVLIYIKIFDCFGEINLTQNTYFIKKLQNLSLDSSVGRAKD